MPSVQRILCPIDFSESPLGMVPGIWHRFAGARHRRNCSVYHGDGGLVGSLRLATDFCQRLRVCRFVYGWELVRVLPAPADRDSFPSGWHIDADETSPERRGLDVSNVAVFPGRGTVLIDFLVVLSPAGLGLASLRRSDLDNFGLSHCGGMAGYELLGDRPFRWNRAGLLRLGLDYAGG